MHSKRIKRCLDVRDAALTFIADDIGLCIVTTRVLHILFEFAVRDKYRYLYICLFI